MGFPNKVLQLRHYLFTPSVFRLYRLAWAGLDWLYPPQCGGCGEEGTRWCSSCDRKTRKVISPVCPICGESQTAVGICARCQANPPRYAGLRSWAVYDGPVRKALHRLKYQQDVALGEALAGGLIALYKGLPWQVDLVVPVPGSRKRHAERGYNQASLLALPVAMCFGVDYVPQALVKSRETRSQVGLDAGQRRDNVANAFHADPVYVSGRRALVIDDLTTTGATLDDCARALLAAGASQVYALTVARAESHLADAAAVP